MPTARELLEQADALMRRNRAGASSAKPAVNVPGEARLPPAGFPPPPVASPRPIQREPIAPSIVHTSLPVEPDEPEFTEPAVPLDLVSARGDDDAAAADPESDGDADFPLLTDAVDEPRPAAGPSPVDEVDLPLLTDAVTEIPAFVDESARGEPSLWELTARGASSVLGPTPDSVIVVPPAQGVRQVAESPREGRDPLGLDQPAPGFSTSAEVALEGEPDGTRPVSTGAEPTGEAFVAEAPGNADSPQAVLPSSSDDSDSPERDEAEHVFSAAVSRSAPEDAEEAAVGAGDPPVAPDAGSSFEDSVADRSLAEPADRDPTPRPAVEAAVESGEPAGALGDAFEQGAGADEVTPERSDAPALAPVQGAIPDFEQQRIREIAEEIGMQVLQRIDIFTDTTLRAQLGERLRPAVDRAASDIVAAINEHVGELLRAQVSEAIEREIESWKRSR